MELAQKEFTEKGVGQTMNMLPKTILDRADLKRTVNSLIMEENAVPKPQVIPSASQTQLSVQGSQGQKSAQLPNSTGEPIVGEQPKTPAKSEPKKPEPSPAPAKEEAKK